jgi:hypothetical protein
MAQGEDGTFRSVCQQNVIKTDLFCGLRFTSGGNGIKTNLGENVETPAAGFQPAYSGEFPTSLTILAKIANMAMRERFHVQGTCFHCG